jgi:hypothetical protein
MEWWIVGLVAIVFVLWWRRDTSALPSEPNKNELPRQRSELDELAEHINQLKLAPAKRLEKLKLSEDALNQHMRDIEARWPEFAPQIDKALSLVNKVLAESDGTLQPTSAPRWHQAAPRDELVTSVNGATGRQWYGLQLHMDIGGKVIGASVRLADDLWVCCGEFCEPASPVSASTIANMLAFVLKPHIEEADVI